MAVDEPTRRVAETLGRSVLFAGWPESALADVAQRCRPLGVSPGTVVCKEGEIGEEMYVIDEGRFAVEATLAGRRTRFAELGSGGVFGEIALVTDRPRSATVSALTDGRLWALPKGEFHRLARAYPQLAAAATRLAENRLDVLRHGRAANEVTPMRVDQKAVIAIGREDTNDLVLDDPMVSRVHARITRSGDEYRIVDLRSTNGTFVNRRRVTSALLRSGDEIWFGRVSLYFDESTLARFSRGGGIKLDAIGLSRTVGKGATILRDVTLSIYPGEFVCIVGGSGTGKTTLLDALSGFRPATQGRVLYNAVDYYEHFDIFRLTLGYVPQDDIVHPELTAYHTLYYAARLRLSSDLTRAEVERGIADALEAIGLTERRRTEVRRLSGGQRKRVSIAVELLTHPEIFYLDEPTSGLDPGLDRRMMELLRSLANQGRTIITTTHATRNIMTCDKVVFMAPVGRLAFFGAPADALSFFGVEDFTDVYGLLESESAAQFWEQKYRTSELCDRNVHQRIERHGATTHDTQKVAVPGGPAPRGSINAPRQFFWLSARYLHVISRDPIALAVLLLAAPIIAFVAASAFGRHIYALTAAEGGDARQGIGLLFILAAASIFLGASAASRAIAEELPIYARERLVNLKLVPYVLSKVTALAVFGLVQSALLVGITGRQIEFPGGGETQAEMLGAIALTNLVAIALGLLISAIANTGLQATLILILSFIPQLILAGAVVPISSLGDAAELFSRLMIARWSLSLLGHAVDINAQMDVQSPRNDWAGQFDIDPDAYRLALAGFFAAFLVGSMLALRAKDQR